MRFYFTWCICIVHQPYLIIILSFHVPINLFEPMQFTPHYKWLWIILATGCFALLRPSCMDTYFLFSVSARNKCEQRILSTQRLRLMMWHSFSHCHCHHHDPPQSRIHCSASSSSLFLLGHLYGYGGPFALFSPSLSDSFTCLSHLWPAVLLLTINTYCQELVFSTPDTNTCCTSLFPTTNVMDLDITAAWFRVDGVWWVNDPESVGLITGHRFHIKLLSDEAHVFTPRWHQALPSFVSLHAQLHTLDVQPIIPPIPHQQYPTSTIKHPSCNFLPHCASPVWFFLLHCSSLE